MSETNGEQERRWGVWRIPVPWSDRPVEVRGLGVIILVLVVLQAIVAWELLQHKEASARSDGLVAQALLLSAVSNRELNCTIRKKQEVRDTADTIAFCKNDAWSGTMIPDLAKKITQHLKDMQ